MLRRFFIWRAEKRMGRSHYKFDRRAYRGVFKPGFFAHLSQTNFWQTDNDPFLRSRRRKKRWILAVSFLVILLLAWVIVESSRALSLF